MSDEIIKKILSQYKKIAVVGLSPQTDRPSYGVSSYLIRKGYEVSGVRPGGIKEILSRPCYEKLADVPKPLEIVDVFRAPEHVPEVVDQAIQEGAKVIWLQLGITHPEAEEKARKAGLLVVSNRCILVEHKRLFNE